MIKVECDKDGAIVQATGDKIVLEAELMAIISAITEIITQEYDMTPEEAARELEKCYKAGTAFAVERLKNK